MVEVRTDGGLGVVVEAERQVHVRLELRRLRPSGASVARVYLSRGDLQPVVYVYVTYTHVYTVTPSHFITRANRPYLLETHYFGQLQITHV